MTPQAYCQEKAANSGSSFYISFLFLPQERRDAIMALYAFCREVDDVVDEVRDPAIAATKLAWWRSELDRLYAGQPQHPVTRALQPALSRFNLPQEHLEEIIDGMAMDLSQNRYPDFKQLQLYCYRVAGVVGLLAAEIFGASERGTQQYARDLGTALQLTNILRDVGEDARRGRIYLPQEDLAQFGVTESELLAGQGSPKFDALMAFEIERARRYYQQAIDTLPRADRKAQRPGLIMAAVYRAVLETISDSPRRVLSQRVSLPTWRKAWLAGRTWLWG